MANLGLIICQLSGYRVRTGYPLTTFSCQGIDGLMDTSATTVLGLLQAALEEVAMSCATQAAPKTEIEVPEVPEDGNEVVVEEKKEDKKVIEDNYYDDDDDDDETPGEESALLKKFKVWWGKAQEKIEKVADKTDEMIGGIAE